MDNTFILVLLRNGFLVPHGLGRLGELRGIGLQPGIFQVVLHRSTPDALSFERKLIASYVFSDVF